MSARLRVTTRSVASGAARVRPGIVVWSHRAPIRPTHISPGHQKTRLAWERKSLTESGRHDQLCHTVERLLAAELRLLENPERDGRLAAQQYALQSADNYARLRDAVKEYKHLVRRDDRAWSRR